MRFKKGLRIMYSASKEPLKYSAAAAANRRNRLFQIKQITFPNNNMHSFFVNSPFRGNVRKI
jgi:hypothetical protein